MKDEDQQRAVRIASTAKRFVDVFPDAAVTERLGGLRKEPAFDEWIEIRNYLSHRSTPGRTFFRGTGSPDPPALWWKLKIDEELTSARLTWLVKALADLLQAAKTFTDEKFEASASEAVIE